MSYLPYERLNALLSRIPDLHVGVIGDFFLDKYLVTDPSLSELSVETGLEARQVVEVRCSPGAAGTVTNNLAALGVGRIDAIGVVGNDGEGFELLRGLRERRVTTDRLLQAPGWFTPTYTKPMVRKDGHEVELERLDIKNRACLSSEWSDHVIDQVSRLMSEGLDALIVMDQVQERDCGTVTDIVRDGIAGLALQFPKTLVFADSRARIGEYRNVILKPNIHEAFAAMGERQPPDVDFDCVAEIGAALASRCSKPVFLTAGELGILVCTQESTEHVRALPVSGPIDIVGAGDSTTAGIVCALCAGAGLPEAAALGNLCAAVTIRKLGTTGTASPGELRELRGSAYD